MRIPFKYGLPLEIAIYCMLFKNKIKDGTAFKADFNSGLKYILGRRLLYYVEEQGINSHQTHGSRSERSTHNDLTIGKLSHDISRLDRIRMITIFNDAARCYDRMRHNLVGAL